MGHGRSEDGGPQPRGEGMRVSIESAALTQLLERQTKHPKVPGSIPGHGNHRHFAGAGGASQGKGLKRVTAQGGGSDHRPGVGGLRLIPKSQPTFLIWIIE